MVEESLGYEERSMHQTYGISVMSNTRDVVWDDVMRVATSIGPVYTSRSGKVMRVVYFTKFDRDRAVQVLDGAKLGGVTLTVRLPSYGRSSGQTMWPSNTLRLSNRLFGFTGWSTEIVSVKDVHPTSLENVDGFSSMLSQSEPLFSQEADGVHSVPVEDPGVVRRRAKLVIPGSPVGEEAAKEDGEFVPVVFPTSFFEKSDDFDGIFVDEDACMLMGSVPHVEKRRELNSDTHNVRVGGRGIAGLGEEDQEDFWFEKGQGQREREVDDIQEGPLAETEQSSSVAYHADRCFSGGAGPLPNGRPQWNARPPVTIRPNMGLDLAGTAHRRVRRRVYIETENGVAVVHGHASVSASASNSVEKDPKRLVGHASNSASTLAIQNALQTVHIVAAWPSLTPAGTKRPTTSQPIQPKIRKLTDMSTSHISIAPPPSTEQWISRDPAAEEQKILQDLDSLFAQIDEEE